MDIKIERKESKTIMLIEADFDQVVAENFGDICEALAKRINTLKELESRQKETPIEIDELMGIIRLGKSESELVETLQKEFGISANAAQFILNASLSDLWKILDLEYLKSTIEKHNTTIREKLCF